MTLHSYRFARLLTALPVAAFTESASAAVSDAPVPAGTAAVGFEAATVVRVIDRDTVELDNGR